MSEETADVYMFDINGESMPTYVLLTNEIDDTKKFVPERTCTMEQMPSGAWKCSGCGTVESEKNVVSEVD